MKEEHEDPNYIYDSVLTTAAKVSKIIDSRLEYGWELVNIHIIEPSSKGNFDRNIIVRIRRKPCQRSWVNVPCSPRCVPCKCLNGDTEPVSAGFHSLVLHFDDASRLEQEMKCFNEALQNGYEFVSASREEDRVIVYMKNDAAQPVRCFLDSLESDTDWEAPNLTFVVKEFLYPYQYKRLIQQVEAHGYECTSCNTSTGHYAFRKKDTKRKERKYGKERHRNK